jgi:hypothetical protein
MNNLKTIQEAEAGRATRLTNLPPNPGAAKELT